MEGAAPEVKASGGSASAPALDHVRTAPTECKNNSTGPCATDFVISELFVSIGKPEPARPEDRARALAEAAGRRCKNSEVCLLSKLIIESKNSAVVSQAKKDLVTKYKPKGPRGTKKWTSNIELDAVLADWKKEFDGLYAYSFCTIDFARIGGSLAKAPVRRLIERGFTHLACIVNTDTSTGPGQHWVCVFVDARAPADGDQPWTVEFFDSAGSPPQREIVRWMEETKKDVEALRATDDLVKTIAVTDVEHQKHNTECGLYALYYIRRRCEGHPHTVFVDGPVIRDAEMVEFRQHVFSGGD